MVYAAKRSKNRCPTHPGALLRDDIIPATGRTKAEIAGLLGISRQHLYDILGERKPVSPAIAVRLGKLFGDGAGIWTRMQGAYDTWHAERTEDVSRIPTIKAKGRLRRFPPVEVPVSAPICFASESAGSRATAGFMTFRKPCYRAGLTSLGTCP